MKAVGASEKQIKKLYLIQDIIFGSIYSILGILLSIITMSKVFELLNWEMATNIYLTLLSLLVGMLITYCTTTIVSKKVFRIDISDAFK